VLAIIGYEDSLVFPNPAHCYHPGMYYGAAAQSSPAGLGIWWWFAPSEHYYAVCVTDPAGGAGRCSQYKKMSHAAATDWYLDVREDNWDSDVSLWRWEGTYWSRIS
jgi:hypothetical protein